MSADNFGVVRKHPKGGYSVVWGSGSAGFDVYPEVKEDAPSFDTPGAALKDAYDNTHIIEYGVGYDPEVSKIVADAEALITHAARSMAATFEIGGDIEPDPDKAAQIREALRLAHRE